MNALLDIYDVPKNYDILKNSCSGGRERINKGGVDTYDTYKGVYRVYEVHKEGTATERTQPNREFLLKLQKEVSDCFIRLLQEIMWKSFGVERRVSEMKEGLRELKAIERLVNRIVWEIDKDIGEIEEVPAGAAPRDSIFRFLWFPLLNRVHAAISIATSAVAHPESRGAHRVVS